MNITFKRILNDLEKIGLKYPEIYDTEVKENLGVVILNLLSSESSTCKIPSKFGMFSGEANLEIKKVLDFSIKELWKSKDYICASREKRLASFSSTEVQSENGQFLENFIGDLNFTAIIKQTSVARVWLDNPVVFMGFMVIPGIFLLQLFYFYSPQIFSNKLYFAFTFLLVACVSVLGGHWLWQKIFTVLVRNRA